MTYAALVCALLASTAGFAGLRRPHGRSTTLLALAGLLASAGFTIGLIVQSQAWFAAGAGAAMLLLASGLIAQSRENELTGQLVADQRVEHISGLPNQRLFFERLAAEHSRTKRTGQRYSVAVFEIDNYALLDQNDRENGLKLLADALGESIRNTDTLGCMEDLTVAVLLVDTLADGAVIGCERACERFFFESCGHDEAAHVSRPLTVSVGIASFDDDTVDPAQVVGNARLALGQLRDRLETGIRVFDAHEFADRRIGEPELENSV